MNARNVSMTNLFLGLMIVVLALGVSVNLASANLQTTLDRDHIAIDFLYHGSELSVRGETEPGADIVVRVTSNENNQHELMKKGKVGGVLWMKVGKLEFGNMPFFYHVRSTQPLDQILSPEERAKHLLGYGALKDQADVKPVSDDTERSRWFGEFVSYKQASNLYSEASDGIQIQDTPTRRAFQHTVQWPYQAGAGKYTLSVYSVKDGRVVDSVSMPVQVEAVGLVRTLASMAFNHSSQYGALSILAALGAGLGVGLVFRKNSGAH